MAATNTSDEQKSVHATLHYLRMTPRKVRAVADLIRGLPASEAEAQLMLQPRRASLPLLKLLRSALSNARQVKVIDVQKLYIRTIQVDQGPMLKRYLPRARGMASPIQKKMSHVTLTLAENPKLAPGRFTIVTKKKTKKLPPEEKRGDDKAKKTMQKSEGGRERVKDPGFFKKIFQRKSI